MSYKSTDEIGKYIDELCVGIQQKKEALRYLNEVLEEAGNKRLLLAVKLMTEQLNYTFLKLTTSYAGIVIMNKFAEENSALRQFEKKEIAELVKRIEDDRNNDIDSINSIYEEILTELNR
jgi:hypothetical protein